MLNLKRDLPYKIMTKVADFHNEKARTSTYMDFKFSLLYYS